MKVQDILAAILKAMGIVPVIVKILAELEAARRAESEGGRKLTPGELIGIVDEGVKALRTALSEAVKASA